MTSRIQAPEQLLLTRLTEAETAEMIERHVEFIDKNGRPVHLAEPFVRHFMKRCDDLPVVTAIAQLPIVLADGGVLAQHRGINRDRGLVFHIPEELMALMPLRQECTPEVVKRALRYLTDVWLRDVATDHKGKCILIAAALSLIERSLLPDRPVFFVTAGRRGSGKTTTLTMLIMAVTGLWPAAAAWSSNEEERRKALLSYFLEGVSYIIWDNIPRGSQISCPHIEKSSTAAYYSDRRLGVSEMVATSAATIHLFTGNNIAPKGDLASRSLRVHLEVDRTDPENREFEHSDPIRWTENHRGEILRALYTILLGNPMLNQPRDARCKTRFKMWWRLIGSALEHAAGLVKQELDFKTVFLGQEEDDEETADLAEALAVFNELWPGGRTFKAVNVAILVNEWGNRRGDIMREFLFPEDGDHKVSSKSVGKRLNRHVDAPVRNGNRSLALKRRRDTATEGPNAAFEYWIQAKDEG